MSGESMVCVVRVCVYVSDESMVCKFVCCECVCVCVCMCACTF